MTFLRRMLAPLPVWPRILLAILCFLTGATQFVQAFRASGAETLAGAGFGIARIILAALALTWPDVTVPIRPIEAPLLIAQGETDDLVLPELQAAYVAARCADGWELDYRTYPGLGHMEVVSEGSPLVGELLAWTADRFAGKPVPATACTPS